MTQQDRDVENQLTQLIQQIAIDEESSRAIAKYVMGGLELKHILDVHYTSDEFKAVQARVDKIMATYKECLARGHTEPMYK
jgi:hypothetical protein